MLGPNLGTKLKVKVCLSGTSETRGFLDVAVFRILDSYTLVLIFYLTFHKCTNKNTVGYRTCQQ